MSEIRSVLGGTPQEINQQLDSMQRATDMPVNTGSDFDPASLNADARTLVAKAAVFFNEQNTPYQTVAKLNPESIKLLNAKAAELIGKVEKGTHSEQEAILLFEAAGQNLLEKQTVDSINHQIEILHQNSPKGL